MGMFDHVRYSAPCYKCGAILNYWQSKSGPCQMETLEIDQVTNLYTACDNRKCKAWNEYSTDATEHETQIVDILHYEANVMAVFNRAGGAIQLEPGKYRVTRISDVKLKLKLEPPPWEQESE